MPDLPLLPLRPRTPVLPAETPGTSGLMMLATGVVVVAALSIAKEVLIPITLAVLLSFVLAPLVDLLRRARLGRVPAVLLAVLLALGIILGLGGMIGAQIAGLANDIPRYASTIQDKVQSLQGVTVGL
jgi:predicted PurR-regulated permease PerM